MSKNHSFKKYKDNQYEDLVTHVLNNGNIKKDRTGTGTLSVFGAQLRYNLHNGFPLITTKKVHMKSVIHELLWFLRGDTNIEYLHNNGVSIWDEWADDHGNLGPIYGKQWRAWNSQHGEIDQLTTIIDELKNNPDSRRLVVSAWNVGDLENMALQPCHALFQFYVANNKLSCQLYQRSADLGLGVPFNIASYSLLTHMVAQQCGYDVGDFIWTGGDCHIYLNHVEALQQQIKREPYLFPDIEINQAPDLYSYSYHDFSLHNYMHHPPISMKVAV